MKKLFVSCFYLNGLTSGFYPEIQKSGASRDRTVFFCSNIEKAVLLNKTESFEWSHSEGLSLELKSENYLAIHRKQHHRKVLLSSFHFEW